MPVPIYEFECDACGARFEELVPVGTEAMRCSRCRADGARRRYSAQSPTPKLVKTPRENRRQERANAELNRSARARFKERRRRTGGSGGEGR